MKAERHEQKKTKKLKRATVGMHICNGLDAATTTHGCCVAQKVGDWSAKVWTEDLPAPVLATRYHAAYLTCGCWSPTRAAVFLVRRRRGLQHPSTPL
jgi:hypothetical protein